MCGHDHRVSPIHDSRRARGESVHSTHKKNRKVIVHTSNVCCNSGRRHNKGGRPRPSNTKAATTRGSRHRRSHGRHCRHERERRVNHNDQFSSSSGPWPSLD